MCVTSIPKGRERVLKNGQYSKIKSMLSIQTETVKSLKIVHKKKEFQKILK